jgi:hypothetical protein
MLNMIYRGCLDKKRKNFDLIIELVNVFRASAVLARRGCGVTSANKTDEVLQVLVDPYLAALIA